MIVTGETSGELYGSLLAVSLKKRIPGLRITGIGGERMKAAGVEMIAGISGAFGLTEAIASLRDLKYSFQKAVESIKTDKPSVIVLIDYPDFNLKLAAVAKKNRVRILYYVSPQVWAWRKRRVNAIASLVDRMAVILPFEEEIYKKAGLQCDFVGHPVLDEIRELGGPKEEMKKKLGFAPDRPLLSLLPGSRSHELKRLLPVLSAFVNFFKKEHDSFQFCVPLAPNTELGRYGPELEKFRTEGAVVNTGESIKALAASDFAVIASGTASLQAVFLGVPMVVIYKLFPMTYWIGRQVIKVRHISLVNILSGREVVRELLQSEVTTENIMNEIKRIKEDEFYRQEMLSAFKKVKDMFAGRNATDRVRDIIMEMAGWR